MNDFNVIVAVLGALVLLLALVSKLLEKWLFPASLIALIVGVLVGPEVLGWIDPAELTERSKLLEMVGRLTLGIGLVGVALRVPRAFPRRNWRALATLIGLGMPLMWGISTVLVLLVLGLPFWMAALIGAMITPTDPIAAGPVVVGPTAEENLPERLRHTISFESGINDGLGYLFVFLPFLMITHMVDEALSHWLVHTLLWDVGSGIVFGALLGYAAARLLNAVETRDFVESEWRLIYTVALALFAVGAGRLIGGDEVLVAFTAGAVFTQCVSQDERGTEKLGQEAVNRFFSMPIFALLGTVLPWSGWMELGWSALLLVVAVLLFRRVPVLLVLRHVLPNVRNTREALFLGWFGPIAVSALYYAALMEGKLHEPVIWDVVSLIICASVVAHGLTVVPLTKLFGRREQAPESSSS